MKDHSLHYSQLSIQDQLLRECKAMAQFAFASGLKVPGALVKPLETYAAQRAAENRELVKTSHNNSTYNQVTEAATTPQSGANIEQLALIHGRLAEIIAPAKPRTVLLLATEAGKTSIWKFLGAVPLIRRMMLIAILALLGLVAISWSTSVNGDPRNFSLFDNYGTSLLLNQLFLLCAAGIGASFSALFMANHYIQQVTFDPIYESSYWIRFVLGLLAGIILATLIPIESYDAATNTGSLGGFGKPILALLGGFSATVVYRILNRLITAVESLVRGDTKDIINAQKEVLKARLTEQTVQGRLQLSTKLTKFQQQLSASTTPKEVQQEFERLVANFITPGSYEDTETIFVQQNDQVGEKTPPAPKITSKVSS